MKQTRPLSYSSLKAFDKSPNHLLAYWNREVSTSAAQLKGILVHSLVLEPDVFDDNYVIYEGKTKRGKAYDAFCEEHKGKIIISQSEYDKASAIKSAVFADENAKALFNETHTTEKLIEWTSNGLDFKGFVDGIGNGFCFDLKTCASSEPNKFSRDAYNYGYHLQAAMYMEATAAEKFYIIAVESEAPYNVTVFKMSADMIQKGVDEYLRLINNFKVWDGKPSSYTELVESLDLPAWAIPAQQIDRF